MYGTACCIQLTKNSKFDIDLSFDGSGSDQAVAKCACGNINGPKHKKELRTSIQFVEIFMKIMRRSPGFRKSNAKSGFQIQHKMIRKSHTLSCKVRMLRESSVLKRIKGDKSCGKFLQKIFTGYVLKILDSALITNFDAQGFRFSKVTTQRVRVLCLQSGFWNHRLSID